MRQELVFIAVKRPEQKPKLYFLLANGRFFTLREVVEGAYESLELNDVNLRVMFCFLRQSGLIVGEDVLAKDVGS